MVLPIKLFNREHKSVGYILNGHSEHVLTLIREVVRMTYEPIGNDE